MAGSGRRSGPGRLPDVPRWHLGPARRCDGRARPTCLGLRRACLALGVRIYEQTRVTSIGCRWRDDGPGRRAGLVLARQVALATSAFPPLLSRLKMMTVPSTTTCWRPNRCRRARGRESVGKAGRASVRGKMFHYYRLTEDDRILFGGYDAVYHYASRIDPAEQAGATHEVLAGHFFVTFPQLERMPLSHKWAGVIDTCTRFSAFWARRTQVAWGTRWLHGPRCRRDPFRRRSDARSVGRSRHRTHPIADGSREAAAVPARPARYAGITMTRWSLTEPIRRGAQSLAAIARQLGLGFDS